MSNVEGLAPVPSSTSSHSAGSDVTNTEAANSAHPSVLFVCSKNGGKSQIAAGYLRKDAGDSIAVSSAGTKPGTSINELAADVLAGQGVDIRGEHHRQLTEADMRAASVVVVLGTEAKVPDLPGVTVEVWETDEPSLRGIEGRARMELLTEDIHRRVSDLQERLLHRHD